MTKLFYERYWKNEHIKANPFDERPSGWTEENFAYHMDFFKPFVKGKVLDFGCGDGQFLHMVGKYCDSTYGVDISDIAINKARNNYPGIDFRVLDSAGKLPYPDSYFDTICAIDVLEHILDIEFWLEEFHRVLKPNANLLIATSEITRIKIILIALTALNNYFYPTSPHIRYFTKDNLVDILKRKSLEVIRYKKNRTYFGFIPRGQMVIATKIE